MQVDLTHAELQAINAFINKIRISDCKSNHEASGLRKIYVATGKQIASEQGF